MLCAYSAFLLPHVYIAAAQFGPTCQALDELVTNPAASSCSRNNACDAVSCSTQTPFPSLEITLQLLPCEDPPAVRTVIAKEGTVLLDDVYNQSVSGIDAGGVTLDITIDQLDDAIGLEVKSIIIRSQS